MLMFMNIDLYCNVEEDILSLKYPYGYLQYYIIIPSLLSSIEIDPSQPRL